MIPRSALPFREVWLHDFEFGCEVGGRPAPRCMVAHELFSGRTIRLWQDGLAALSEPPFSIGKDTLFVAYNEVAEASCFLVLGWPTPVHVLDLYVEFRNLTNGVDMPAGRSLLGALEAFGIDGIDTAEKTVMRELALRGPPYSEQEKRDLLAYCETDVAALKKLLPRMLPRISLPHALIRGRYMPACARMEHEGVPIDVDSLRRLRSTLAGVKDRLIERVDALYGVYDGTTFKRDKFLDWVTHNGLAWPLLPSGIPALDGDTFHEMGRIYPAVAALGGLRETLGDMRLADLAVGTDGRNRTPLWPYQAKTSRNGPSTTRFIFGPKVWLRGLIKPPEGYAMAYPDFDQEEFAIAAALSGDEAMMAAYRSGDAYLGFAAQAGAVPPGATKKSHGPIRGRYKISSLGILYGMEPPSISQRIGRPLPYAVELLQQHKRLYGRYWRWSDAAVDHGTLLGGLHTVFGWTLRPNTKIEPHKFARTLRNFPMQANGAEIMRLACIFATEAGIHVCAPVHDALLIIAPISEIQHAVAVTKAAMIRASAVVLGGFELRVGGAEDEDIIYYPDRYMDADRGAKLWATVWELIDEADRCIGAPVRGIGDAA